MNPLYSSQNCPGSEFMGRLFDHECFFRIIGLIHRLCTGEKRGTKPRRADAFRRRDFIIGNSVSREKPFCTSNAYHDRGRQRQHILTKSMPQSAARRHMRESAKS